MVNETRKRLTKKKRLAALEVVRCHNAIIRIDPPSPLSIPIFTDR